MISAHHLHVDAEGLDQTRIVGGIGAVAVRMPQQDGREALRGLDRAQFTAVRRAEHQTGVVHTFEGVGDRQSGHHSFGAVRQGGHHAAEQFRRHQGPGGVVHQHQVGLFVGGGQSGAHRVASFGAAGHHGHFRRSAGRVIGAHVVDQVRRHDHHHLVHHAAHAGGRHAAVKQRGAGYVYERLGLRKSQTGSHSRSRDEGGDAPPAVCGQDAAARI